MAVRPNPCLRPHFTHVISPGKGVLLLSESSSRVLRSDIYERLIPLLDGTRSADQLVEVLTPEFSAAQVYCALIFLQGTSNNRDSLAIERH